MGATDVIKTSLERNWGMVDRALEGLDDATLSSQPNDQSNSIAWLLWHMNRVVDTFINTRLRSKPQVWVQGDWCGKFGMSGEPETTGQGWSSDRVAGWAPPSREVQLGYFEAIKSAARDYLGSLTEADLDASLVVPPANEPRAVSDMLGILVYDNVVHGGQIAYLRGYYKGLGWFV